MGIRSLLLYSFFLFPPLAGLVTCAEEMKPVLIPLPEKVEWRQGSFVLSDHVRIVSSTAQLTKYFEKRIQILTGIAFDTSSKENSGGEIIFQIGRDSATESYSLSVEQRRVTISSESEEGVFRGMQTFFQLIAPEAKAHRNGMPAEIPSCEIFDRPAFRWRGLNLDCSRHFMSKEFIKRYLDILAYYKMNVFHWHLTDDQGWRIEIRRYPQLTRIGAWRTEADGSRYGGYYTQEDIRDIVAYAQRRFITVVPEIEMPGHCLASLAAYPENSCTGGPFEVGTVWGVMKDVYCAGRDSTFTFLENILDEVIGLFPSPYIHIGGDEVPKDRWKACPRCQARIKAEGLHNEEELQSYFIKRIADYLHSKGKTMIGWEEILQGGLAPGAIVQAWQSMQPAIEAAQEGHCAICSPASHTYLNADPEDLDLRTAYSFKPIPDELSAGQQKFILGAEANLWTEYAPQETVDQKLFPRLLALAEVFWKNPKNRNYEEFHTRMQRAYDDLSALGIEYGREGKVVTYSTSYDTARSEFSVDISSVQDGVQIRYTTDGSAPSAQSELYRNRIKIQATSSLAFAAFKGDHFIGKQFTLAFDFHKALGAKLVLLHPYDERYRAGGETALIDGIRGTNDFRDGAWQGFEGVDVDAVIDLGKERKISKVIPRFLMNTPSWIFLPKRVGVSLSDDGTHFHDKKEISDDVPQKNPEILFKDFPIEFDTVSARFIKLAAENIKVCPPWHPGAGGKAWLFIDEIVVK
ncbi:MAG: family 20 glycosylhydrolase [Bacteroidota bacterium]|nr:family 20 glycosylhydrolase [Bacteroidota bacterium]